TFFSQLPERIRTPRHAAATRTRAPNVGSAVMKMKLRRLMLNSAALLLFPLFFCHLTNAAPTESFQNGLAAYRANEYKTAAASFRQIAATYPGSGTLQNLGLAEWQR